MTSQPDIFENTTKGLILRVRLTPKAAREHVGGFYLDEHNRGWLKATVTAVPENGRANKALIALLSKKTGIRKSAFTITSGETDRHKTFLITPDAEQALLTLCAQP